MYILHKLLPIVILPTGLIIISLVLSVITRRRRFAVLPLVIVLLLSNRLVETKLMQFANGDAIHANPANLPEASAIVVLSEGRQVAPGGISEWVDSDRFWGGIDCYEAKRAPLLVFTGGTAPDLPSDPLEGSILALYAKRVGVPATHILVSDRVLTTADEAVAVAKMLKASAMQHPKIILVTSAYHMPRSVRLFEAQGFTVSAYPVDFKVESLRTSSLEDWLPTAKAFGLSEMVIRELEGRWFYRLFY